MKETKYYCDCCGKETSSSNEENIVAYIRKGNQDVHNSYFRTYCSGCFMKISTAIELALTCKKGEE